MRRSAADVMIDFESGVVNENDGFGLDCDPAEDRTRQEFKAEVEIETILRRYGAQAGPPMASFGGEVDFDFDLQDALNAHRSARAEYMRAPEELRKMYKTYGAFVRAVERGEVGVREVVEAAPVPPVVPSAE